MGLPCPYCASTKSHRSHRYGLDFFASTLFGEFPYRCSACNRRFRAKRNNSSVEEPASGPHQPQAEGETSRRRHDRSLKPAPRKTSKRAFLRELLLYALALSGFLAFLRWITEDHPSQPPQ